MLSAMEELSCIGPAICQSPRRNRESQIPGSCGSHEDFVGSKSIISQVDGKGLQGRAQLYSILLVLFGHTG